MRIGILGGSFDPVHAGHIGVARAVAETAGLDKVWLMPAAQAPLRDAHVRASGAQRAEMVRRAIADAGDARLELCTRELDRGGVSYTAETLRSLRATHPADEFTWIVGEDQFARLGAWREPEQLAALAEWAVYARPGWSMSAEAPIRGLRWRRVEAKAEWAISSSEVRARLASGGDVSGWLSDKVIEYITKNGLYRAQ
ncbi:MAG: nicotinate-nucleotide adenylyltransferase [Opitutaceae bacterium]|jgi:nicotinate-nucleotide adenylyltransferase|nr:nicotinate-nucleotide adenylyltransferase [Opitutaceae bacterium]